MGHLEKKITYSNNMPFKMGTLDLLSKYGVDDFVECDKPRSGESGVLIVYSRLLLMRGGVISAPSSFSNLSSKNFEN